MLSTACSCLGQNSRVSALAGQGSYNLIHCDLWIFHSTFTFRFTFKFGFYKEIVSSKIKRKRELYEELGIFVFKVMQVDGDQATVKFFGDHNKSIVSLSNCTLLTLKPPVNQKSKKGSYNAAMDEIESYVRK